MIRLEQVAVALQGKMVLQDVTFCLAKGQSVGIIGPNGAGKSTLLQVMGGHLQPAKGQVCFYGKAIHTYRKKELAKRVAFMRQIASATVQFTSYETVMLARYPFLRRFQPERPVDHEIGRLSMERTRTWHLRNRHLDEISGGERQRVFLAQVLAQQPELLLLDEPTTFLDLFHQLELLTLLKQEQTNGLSWVAVLHDLNLAAQYCDRLLLLNNGRMVMFGTPQEVFHSRRLEEVFGVRITVVDVPEVGAPQIVVTPKPAISQA